MRRAVGARLAAALAIGGALATIPPVALAEHADTDPFEAIAALDRRVQDTGWNLIRANAPFCTTTQPAIGLLLQDLQSWREPDAARAALGLAPATQVTVGAVASGSPAARAGLVAGQPLRTIGDMVLDSDLAPAAAGSYARQAMLHDRIDALLDRNGWVAIGVDGDESEDGERRQGALLRIAAEPTCASRFEVVTAQDSAEADGRRVLIGADIARDLTDPDQFAFVVAHELAHNLLAHPALLAREGRRRFLVRRTEREADRLALWLMTNAGYDTAGAAAFLRGWAREHDGGFLLRTHDAWDERAEAVEAEAALIAATTPRLDGYDWSARFPPGPGIATPEP